MGTGAKRGRNRIRSFKNNYVVQKSSLPKKGVEKMGIDEQEENAGKKFQAIIEGKRNQDQETPPGRCTSQRENSERGREEEVSGC